MTNNDKHFDLIHRNCEVLAEVFYPQYAVYFMDDGRGYVEMETPDGGIDSFSCSSVEEFHLIVNNEEDDFQEFEDEDLEEGFDPYEGCYTYDC